MNTVIEYVDHDQYMHFRKNHVKNDPYQEVEDFYDSINCDFIESLKKDIIQNSDCKINLLIFDYWSIAKSHDYLDSPTNFIRKNAAAHPSKVNIYCAYMWEATCYIGKIEEWKKEGYNIKFVGYDSKNYVTPWCLITTLLNKNPSSDYELKKDFKYTFCCYNNQPRPYRIELVTKLCEEKLVEDNLVTFKKGYFPIIDEKYGNIEPILRTQPKIDNSYTFFDIVCNVGDLKIWRDFYCWVATESLVNDPYWLSEKVFKPLFCLKPYLIYSDDNTYKLLDKMGFYTPAELFDDKNLEQNNIETISQKLIQLNNMSKEELYTLYQKQLPMLIHNRELCLKYANKKFDKILDSKWFIPSNKTLVLDK
jgi:hypothetical protein